MGAHTVGLNALKEGFAHIVVEVRERRRGENEVVLREGEVWDGKYRVVRHLLAVVTVQDLDERGTESTTSRATQRTSRG